MRKPAEGLPEPVLADIQAQDKKYRQVSQMAFYSSLDDIAQLQIFTKSSCDV